MDGATPEEMFVYKNSFFLFFYFKTTTSQKDLFDQRIAELIYGSVQFEIEQLLKSQEGTQLQAIQPVTFAGKADENCWIFMSRFEQYADSTEKKVRPRPDYSVYYYEA